MSVGTTPDRERLAAEYAIGLLEGEERREAERLAETDPPFQAAAARWQGRLAELDQTATPMPAPNALWSRIEANLEAKPTPLPVNDPLPVIVPSPRAAFAALWRSLPFWRMAGMAGAFASLLLALGIVLLATRAAREPVLVAVLLTDQNRPAAVINAFANGGAELIPLQGLQIPAGRALEVWAIPDPQGRPVSVGVLNEIRSRRLDLARIGSPRPEQVFAVSLEPSGGSPTGQPTGPVLMKGTASTAL
jgi:anti-sigma-K factor RskA